jgi:hypothetical protein
MHGGSLQTVLIRTTRPQSTPSISNGSIASSSAATGNGIGEGPVAQNTRPIFPHELHFANSQSPGPQLGNGQINNSLAAHIDYSAVLPTTTDRIRHFSQQADTQHITDRLSEMEFLMRSGTPTAVGRSRMCDLVHDVTSIINPLLRLRTS